MDGLFTPENREAWQKLFDSVAADRPSVGKQVKVTGGRKHLGKVGQVFWHGRDRYSDLYRYGSPAQRHLWDAQGRAGWRVGVATADGERFFVKADQVDLVRAEQVMAG